MIKEKIVGQYFDPALNNKRTVIEVFEDISTKNTVASRRIGYKFEQSSIDVTPEAIRSITQNGWTMNEDGILIKHTGLSCLLELLIHKYEKHLQREFNKSDYDLIRFLIMGEHK